MKKTLFLSAILGAALCSNAFAETETITLDETTYENTAVITAESVSENPGGDYILLNRGGNTNFTISATSNTWAQAENTQTIIGSPATRADETTSAGSRIKIDNTTVYADIIAGGSAGDDIWTVGGVVLKGDVTIAKSLLQIWLNSSHTKIDGALNGEGKTLKMVGRDGSNSSLTLSGGGTVGTINADQNSGNVVLSATNSSGGAASGTSYTIGTLTASNLKTSFTVQNGVTATIGTLTNGYQGTITNAGTLTLTNANLAAGATIENTGTLNVTGTLTVDYGTSTLKGDATLGKISIGDADSKVLVIDGGNVTFNQLNNQNLGGSSARIRLANDASLTTTSRVWTNGATLYLQNTTVNGETTGGTLTLKGFLSGVGDSGGVGNLSIAEHNTLKITGTAATNSTDNGFIIWNGKAHVYTIDGSLIIENGIRAQKMGSAQGTTSSSETFNISSTGLLQLNKGITYVTGDNTLQSMGTINVNGGTLAIGGQTTGSKAKAVNLADGSTLKALDETTSTAQNFTLADNATVTLLAENGKALTLNAALNNETATVIAQGGGAVSLGNSTLASLTAKANTVVTLANNATIGSALTVENGARVEMNDATHADVTLAGGTIKVTATDNFNGQHFASLTLTANSTLDLTAQNSGLINKDSSGFTTATLDLGSGKTLTINGTRRFCIMDAEATSTGKIAMGTAGGYLQIAHSDVKDHTADLSSAVVELYGTHLVIASGNTLKVAALDQRSGSSTGSALETEGDNGSPVLEIVGDGGTHTYRGGFAATNVDLSMTGAGTQNFSMSGNIMLHSLTAEAGTMNFHLNNKVLSAGTLTLSGGEVNVFKADNSSDAGQITTTNLTVTENTEMEANLVVLGGGTMDFSAVIGTGATLTMGCSVNIGNDVTVVIDESVVNSIIAGNTFDIIDSVDSITSLGSWHFQNAVGDSLDWANLRLEEVENGDGTSRIVVAPEPATATLSLLALAALAARRKRH